MYNKAPRVCNAINSQTPPFVGPTTYILCDNRDRKVNTVPFLSSEKKVAKFFNKSFCEALYEAPDHTKEITGGSTPRNRTPRFIWKDSDTPAPGDYDPRPQGKCGKRTRLEDIPKGRKLYVCHVPYNIKGSGPSMPIDVYGYYVDADDNIIKIPPPPRDPTLGPAYYHVKTSTFCEHYRGCRWSHRSSKRSFYAANSNPGPGTYNLQITKCAKRTEEEEYREMARLFSFQPRFIEAQGLKSQREGLPGPGHYNIGNIKICRGCPGIHPKPFISRSERFKDNPSGNPPPGQYDIKTMKYMTSKLGVPFSVTTDRFSKKKGFETPGPGYYNIKSPLVEKLLSKKNKFALFEPPFNKTAVRDVSNIKKDAEYTPSPAHYTLEVEGHCRNFDSSIFKSKKPRFTKLCKKNEISPAHYNITEAFNKNKSHLSHQAYEVSFNSTAKRKGILSTLGNPGPADYLGQSKVSSKGFLIPTTSRFGELGNKIPGPGTYSCIRLCILQRYYRGGVLNYKGADEAFASLWLEFSGAILTVGVRIRKVFTLYVKDKPPWYQQSVNSICISYIHPKNLESFMLDCSVPTTSKRLHLPTVGRY